MGAEKSSPPRFDSRTSSVWRVAIQTELTRQPSRLQRKYSIFVDKHMKLISLSKLVETTTAKFDKFLSKFFVSIKPVQYSTVVIDWNSESSLHGKLISVIDTICFLAQSHYTKNGKLP